MWVILQYLYPVTHKCSKERHESSGKDMNQVYSRKIFTKCRYIFDGNVVTYIIYSNSRYENFISIPLQFQLGKYVWQVNTSLNRSYYTAFEGYGFVLLLCVTSLLVSGLNANVCLLLQNRLFSRFIIDNETESFILNIDSSKTIFH